MIHQFIQSTQTENRNPRIILLASCTPENGVTTTRGPSEPRRFGIRRDAARGSGDLVTTHAVSRRVKYPRKVEKLDSDLGVVNEWLFHSLILESTMG
jgi:hypothetical protein